MGDEHDPAGAGGEEPGETLQPVAVQVVGGLVEQDHVTAGHRQGGKPGARGLPPGQRAQGPVQAPGIEAEPVEGRSESRLTSAPPSASQRSSATACGSTAARSPAASAEAQRSTSRVAPATPMRSLIVSRTVSRAPAASAI